MIPDAFILEARAKVVRELPWPLPATVLLEMTDEDLDWLASARDGDEYWRVLNGIVPRLIVAAKVKRLEIVRERHEAELGPLLEARKRAQARLEEATAKRLAAVEEEGAARGEDSSANMRIRHTKQRAEQVERDLRALRGEA